MEEVLYKLHFDDLEVTSLVSEPWGTYSLFETEVSDHQAEQLKIFKALEKDLTLF